MTKGGVRVKTWTCPHCNAEVQAIASAVGHRCPANRNRFTNWKKESDG
jgi:hypothetical protein